MLGLLSCLAITHTSLNRQSILSHQEEPSKNEVGYRSGISINSKTLKNTQARKVCSFIPGDSLLTHSGIFQSKDT